MDTISDINKACRTCMLNNNDQQTNFNMCYENENKIKISEMLILCASVEVPLL